MELNVGSRLKHAWNAFLNRDPTVVYRDIGSGYSYRPDNQISSVCKYHISKRRINSGFCGIKS